MGFASITYHTSALAPRCCRPQLARMDRDNYVLRRSRSSASHTEIRPATQQGAALELARLAERRRAPFSSPMDSLCMSPPRALKVLQRNASLLTGTPVHVPGLQIMDNDYADTLWHSRLRGSADSPASSLRTANDVWKQRNVGENDRALSSCASLGHLATSLRPGFAAASMHSIMHPTPAQQLALQLAHAESRWPSLVKGNHGTPMRTHKFH